VEIKPRSYDKIVRLSQKGVDIPNPLTLDIGEEVDLERISGQGVKIYPGCRIYGEETVISAGAQLGYEGPVTIDNCQIGPEVELRGGYFKKAVFLEKASMGLAAHVREGCILEEQANGAHGVGLKQTILFPFVTLGSLINFCDCLMAGGTSRKDHSEVGSSYIHFNFTPTGDKTTPSLIGDVPRGVMLNQAPIFLGGQGGMVGPIRLGYGNVVAAGTVLRNDCTEDGKLIIGKTHHGGVMDFSPRAYPRLSRLLENNFLYLANLAALGEWYAHVRRPFLMEQPLGEHLFAGLMKRLRSGVDERIKRLKALAAKIPADEDISRGKGAAARDEFHDRVEAVCDVFAGEIPGRAGAARRDRFLTDFFDGRERSEGGYIKVVKGLPGPVSREGTLWLEAVIRELCFRVTEVLPASRLFRHMRA